MNRTVLSLPGGLYYRVKSLAAAKNISMAAVIREAIEASSGVGGPWRVAEPQAVYNAPSAGPLEEDDRPMKRIVVSLPEELHERVLRLGAQEGISMAAYVRNLLAQRTLEERPKPRFGAFASGYTDTGRLAGEIQYEPRSWR